MKDAPRLGRKCCQLDKKCDTVNPWSHPGLDDGMANNASAISRAAPIVSCYSELLEQI